MLRDVAWAMLFYQVFMACAAAGAGWWGCVLIA